MATELPTGCIIYCRVSSKKQLLEGDGLRSQEKRCRDYAASKGYKVLRVFQDEGVSGSMGIRPAMTEILAFLGGQEGEVVVIVDDIKRFARDVTLHFSLKFALAKNGGRLESPSFSFDDSPEGKFFETLFAAQAELELNQNRRQVHNRTRARLEQGFWTFRLPPGYQYAKHALYNKVVVRDPQKAALVQEALEGFASGRFCSPMEIVRFFSDKGLYGPHPPGYTAKLEMVTTLLRHILYTGYLEYKPWGISLRKGHHPALISLADYEKIQHKLNGKMTTLTRIDVREEFPLRNFVSCKACGRLMTASWSRGRTKRYPYYHCPARGCPQYGKTIGKERMEKEFEERLKRLAVTDQVLDVVKAKAGEVWQEQIRHYTERRMRLATEIEQAEEDLRNLADKLARSKSEVVSDALEERIEEVSREHRQLLAQLETDATQLPDFGTAFEQVRHILRNPYLIWETGDLKLRRLVVRLAFNGKLEYDRQTGFGTTELSLPYLIAGQVAVDESSLVDKDRKTWNLYIEIVLEWNSLLNSISAEQQSK